MSPHCFDGGLNPRDYLPYLPKEKTSRIHSAPALPFLLCAVLGLAVLLTAGTAPKFGGLRTHAARASRLPHRPAATGMNGFGVSDLE